MCGAADRPVEGSSTQRFTRKWGRGFFYFGSNVPMCFPGTSPQKLSPSGKLKEGGRRMRFVRGSWSAQDVTLRRRLGSCPLKVLGENFPIFCRISADKLTPSSDHATRFTLILVAIFSTSFLGYIFYFLFLVHCCHSNNSPQLFCYIFSIFSYF